MTVTDHLEAESAEVYYSRRDIGRADAQLVAFLKERATENARKRCRVCFHPSPGAPQQEMMIAMHRDSYVAPHKHTGKGETLLVLEGMATAPIFTDDGTLLDAIRLGDAESGRTFFYRMPEGIYHGLWIDTEWLIYIETTIGPFRRDATTFPDWAMAAENSKAIAAERERQLAAVAALFSKSEAA